MISVVTPTVGRLNELERCLVSVSKQDTTEPIEHIVVGDNVKQELFNEIVVLCEKYNAFPHNYSTAKDLPSTSYEPVRTGRVRNFGISVAKGEFIGHLDEDNSFEHNHLSSLVKILKKSPQIDIAYSWRNTLDKSGNKLVLKAYPWVISGREKLANEVFELLVQEGLFIEGKSIICDKIPTSHGDLFHIDSSEWVMNKNVFEIVKFRESATPREMIYQFSEDYMFCKEAFEKGITFKSSQKATLNYYFCGYSSSIYRY